MTFKFIAPLGAAALMSACISSTTSQLSPTALSELQDDVTAIMAASGGTPTSQAIVDSASGAAEYDGALYIDGGSTGVTAIGEASMTVNFDNGNALSGSADGFHEIDIASGGGSSDPNDYDTTAIDGSFTVNAAGDGLDGQLTHANGDEVTYELFVVDVDFYGSTLEALEVSGDGNQTIASQDTIVEFEFGGLEVNGGLGTQ